MGKQGYDSLRAAWRLILRFAPTCDLQWELGRRPGVQSTQLGPFERRDFSAVGPATVTVNVD